LWNGCQIVNCGECLSGTSCHGGTYVLLFRLVFRQQHVLKLDMNVDHYGMGVKQ
jgi:hypothetical protein